MANEGFISDKMAVLQVLGCLAKNPLLFTDRDYKFSVDDFPEQFHRIVYGAIENLAAGGAAKIDPIDVDQYLVNFPAQYKVFTDNRGIEYIKRAQDAVEEGNLKYYYTILKKFSLLHKMKQSGIDTSEIYDATLTDPRKIAAMQDKFNGMGVNDILEFYEGKIVTIKQDFETSNDIIESKAGDGIMELVDKYKEKPEKGIDLVSPVMTTIFSGRRLKKFYLESSAQGMGKSRRAAGEACHLAVPQFYDTDKKVWKKNHSGISFATLLISTELEREECQTMWMAYVSGVPEDHILNGTYEMGEEARVRKAAEYIAKSNLHFVQISDFDIDDIENIIRKYHYMYKVQYVFYDYLATSLKVISGVTSKARLGDMKEYQVLNMFGQRLKLLCNSLNIHIQTATQLTRDWKNKDNPDSDSLRGAYALGDQPDVASIMLPIRERDADVINEYLSRGFEIAPNMVINIYKIRRGKYNMIKLYVFFDKGTCRLKDCFCTDYDGNFLNIEGTYTEVEKILNQTVSETPPTLTKDDFADIEF